MINRVVKQRLNSNSEALNWVYRFDANADNNCFRERNGVPQMYHPHQRAIHMDELCYLFKPSFVTVPERGSQSFKLIEHMVKSKFLTNHFLIINFY